ncbi:amino-acid N-acetyltransferase [Pseudokineococcus basanitobsidens]|uniref:Amino-acid N-acetyltransferase n=1 Tax=Pseudokineococcus basanitobsidens TaxID=1926649 RepID=A0ABU8RGX3_9ACTN
MVRPARTPDVRAVRALTAPLAERRVLVAKEAVAYYEGLPELVVAEAGGRVVGCGALHVFWEDLAEVRTLAVADEARGAGVGGLVLAELLHRARDVGVARVFCLTFETRFFAAHGFEEIDGTPVEPEVFAELLRSHDDGVAEFLDLARVKPNTLGNTRMIRYLDEDARAHDVARQRLPRTAGGTSPGLPGAPGGAGQTGRPGQRGSA